MLIEKRVEQLIAEAIKAAFPAFGVGCARNTNAVEAFVDSTVIAVVSVGLRSHNEFSLPTVEVRGSVSVSTRAELDPTGEMHEEAVEGVIGIFDGWHFDAQGFSTAISTDEFFATELRLSGGSGKRYDEDKGAWIEDFEFTIIGSVNH